MDQKLHHTRVFSLLIILFLLAWTGNTAKALRLNFYPRILDKTPNSPADRIIARVYFLGANDEEKVASHLDVLEVHDKECYLIALLSPKEWQELSMSGRRLEVDVAKTATFNRLPR